MIEVDISTKEVIRRYVSKGGDDERHKPKPNIYHASNVWKCYRKMYYDRNGQPEEGEKPHGLFEMGRRAEDVLYGALRHHYGYSYVLNSIPVRIEVDDFVIVGETDPVLIGPNLKPRRVYECKSTEARDPLKMTKGAHKHQSAVYDHALQPEEGTFIVHPGRSDLLRNMPDDDYVMLDNREQLWAESEAWFKNFHAYITKGELPPAQPMEDWECKYCPFKMKCREDGGWVKRGGGMGRELPPITDD